MRDQIKLSLGLGEPFHVRYLIWLEQFFVNEPLNLIEKWTGWTIGDGDRLRVISWQTRSPVVDLIAQRMPQTLWVVGLAYVVGILIAVPIGVISAYRQYSWFDQFGTLFAIIGFSVPTFFTGLLLIVIFRVQARLAAVDLRHQPEGDRPRDLLAQVKQMIMPVTVLALFNAAQISRYMRASMLDNLEPGLRADRARQGPEGAVGGARSTCCATA